MTFREELHGCFEKYMAYREAAGFATATYRSTVPPFLDFCARKHPDEPRITQSMVDEWLAHREYHHNTQCVFISALREYTKYLHFLGRDSYVPDDDYSSTRIAYTPYLFTDEELKKLFDGFDNYRGFKSGKRNLPELILPVYSRMLYCCGMRPSEPQALRRIDVKLDNGDVYIRQSKRNKDRHILMSNDMLTLCRRYDELAGEREWFFQRYNGKPFGAHWFTAMFNRIWDEVGLPRRGNPRPYDLRHAFASRNIIRWLEAG